MDGPFDAHRGDDQAAIIAKILVDLQRDPDVAERMPLGLDTFKVTYGVEPAEAAEDEDEDPYPDDDEDDEDWEEVDYGGRALNYPVRR